MPVQDGISATRDIRQKTKKDSLLIYGLSANSDEESNKLALEAGMNELLLKPIRVRELRRALASAKEAQMTHLARSLVALPARSSSSNLLSFLNLASPLRHDTTANIDADINGNISSANANVSDESSTQDDDDSDCSSTRY